MDMIEDVHILSHLLLYWWLHNNTDMDLAESLMDFKNHTFIIEIKGLIFQWWILLLVLLVIIGVLGRNETALAQYWLLILFWYDGINIHI